MGVVHHSFGEGRGKGFCGGLVFAAIMVFLVLLECVVSGVMFEYTPRFDILFMIFLRSRRVKIAYLPLFFVGIVRDVVYYTPIMSSSITCVFAGSVLNGCDKGLPSWSGYIRAMTVLHGVLWVVSSMANMRIVSVTYLVSQIFISVAATALFMRNKAESMRVY